MRTVLMFAGACLALALFGTEASAGHRRERGNGCNGANAGCNGYQANAGCNGNSAGCNGGNGRGLFGGRFRDRGGFFQRRDRGVSVNVSMPMASYQAAPAVNATAGPDCPGGVCPPNSQPAQRRDQIVVPPPGPNPAYKHGPGHR